MTTKPGINFDFHDPPAVTERNFGNVLVAFFRHHYHGLQHSYPDEISFYLNTVDQYLPFTEHGNMMDILIEFLFSCFEVFRSRGIHVQRTLREYCLRTLQRRGIVKVPLTNPHFLRDFRHREVKYCVRPLSDQAFDFESIYFPMFLQDYEAVRRLVRYGVRFDLKESYTGYYLTIVRSLLTSKYFVISYVDLTRENPRRLHYFLMAFYITFVKMEPSLFPDYENYHNSFKLLFKTVAEPILTLPEYDRILKKLLTDRSQMSDIDAYLKEFEKLFPKCFEPIQPRTLTHLCRVQVRDSLSRSKNLPHGVWRMGIPKRIQNYILLQKNEGECHGKFVSKLAAMSPPCRV